MRRRFERDAANGPGFRRRAKATAIRPAVAAWLLAVAALARAQAPDAETSPGGAARSAMPDAAAVDAKIAALEADASLDIETLSRALYLLEQTREYLKAEAMWRAKLAEFEEAIRAAPSMLEEAKAELAQPFVEPVPDLAPDAPAEAWDQALAQAQADVERRRGYLRELDDEPRRRDERRAQIPARLAELTELIEKAREDAGKPPPPGDPAAVAEATAMLAPVRLAALETEYAALRAELASYDDRTELLPLRRDRTARRLARAERLLELLQEGAAEARRKQAMEAERRAREAQFAGINSHPALRPYVDATAETAKRRAGPEGVVARIEAAREDLAEADEDLAAIDAEFRSIREKIEFVGLSNAIGQLMRRKREEIPRPGPLRRRIAERQSEVQAIQLETMELDDKMRALRDAETEARETLAALEGVAVDGIDLEAHVREALAEHRRAMADLRADLGLYFETLVTLDARERQLVARAEDFRAFIDENVLWIVSATPVRLSELPHAWRGLAWLLDPGNLADATLTLAGDLRRNPLLATAFALLATLWLFAQRRLRASIALAGEVAAMGAGKTIGQTLRVAFDTLAVALMGPALLAILGWRLETAADGEHARALGGGILAASRLWSGIAVVRHVCRRKGLAEAHFGWPPRTLETVRRWAMPVAGVLAPATTIVSAMERQSSQVWRDSTEQIALVVAFSFMTFAAWRILDPAKGATRPFAASPKPAVARRARMSRPLTAAAFAGLALAAATGYGYTSVELAIRLAKTFALAFGLLVVRALVLRRLRLAQSRLSIDAVRRRAEASERTDGESPPEADARVNVVELGAQVRSVTRAFAVAAFLLGSWFVWVDMLPALGFLDRVELPWKKNVATASAGMPNLFPMSATGDGAASDSASASASPLAAAPVALVPVTLGDLVAALFIAFLATAAARNLDGVLQLTLYQRANLDAGARYATNALAQYAIVLFAGMAALGRLGIGWESVQWLAAAVTVGLGFGLQEIFANFVSGLILLFERPIRPGDLVTIGDVSGSVARIRIRATTILDWDRKELVVPNKEFITGRLVNWTLSDRILRIVIAVGVAYESDPARAREILLRLANEDPRILSDPPPQALFRSFGDSSLNFELRAFVGDVSDSLEVQHDLHERILQEFREAGIEIAFPQREIRVRSFPRG